ncbi:hypothetical protein RDWZM_010341 [Blomia tropicalis]|uniref:Topoisomerase 6 subunit A/Spo11 TOPRIM domain-containing protein n=1 Tax=Blomia tropicalis TaxID=40697 RepID=A0A9Q0RIN3_BLOTA|nr:hypothetical protein RDWZM_010341 [Blomia tropicalis]
MKKILDKVTNKSSKKVFQVEPNRIPIQNMSVLDMPVPDIAVPIMAAHNTPQMHDLPIPVMSCPDSDIFIPIDTDSSKNVDTESSNNVYLVEHSDNTDSTSSEEIIINESDFYNPFCELPDIASEKSTEEEEEDKRSVYSDAYSTGEWDDTKIESSKEVAKLQKSITDTESISMNNQIQISKFGNFVIADSRKFNEPSSSSNVEEEKKIAVAPDTKFKRMFDVVRDEISNFKRVTLPLDVFTELFDILNEDDICARLLEIKIECEQQIKLEYWNMAKNEKRLANEYETLEYDSSGSDWSSKCDIRFRKVLRSFVENELIFDKVIGYYIYPKTRLIWVPFYDLHVYVKLINIMLKNVKNKTYSSMMQLFLKNPSEYRHPKRIERFIRNICLTISLRQCDVGISVPSKGLVTGDLVLKDDDGQTYDLHLIDLPMKVPHSPQQIKIDSSEADFILVVEMYGTFYELLMNNIKKKFHMIMITGCGMPDIRTRLFLHRLATELKIPVLMLADTNPFSISTIINYRYGSPYTLHENIYMNVPFLRWIGINGNDIQHFNFRGRRFHAYEREELENMLEEDHVKDDRGWFEQISAIIEFDEHIQIENIHKKNPNFIVDHYLPYKLNQGDWV